MSQSQQHSPTTLDARIKLRSTIRELLDKLGVKWDIYVESSDA